MSYILSSIGFSFPEPDPKKDPYLGPFVEGPGGILQPADNTCKATGGSSTSGVPKHVIDSVNNAAAAFQKQLKNPLAKQAFEAGQEPLSVEQMAKMGVYRRPPQRPRSPFSTEETRRLACGAVADLLEQGARSGMNFPLQPMFPPDF